jgi:hypothetical protein
LKTDGIHWLFDGTDTGKTSTYTFPDQATWHGVQLQVTRVGVAPVYSKYVYPF